MKKNILIAFLALAITAVLFDVAAYALRPQETNGEGLPRPFTQDHPTVGWIGIPHVETTLRWKGTPEIEVRNNSLGFRDREFVPERPSSVFRIVVLDDSFG
jgi:hypothetical protein